MKLLRDDSGCALVWSDGSVVTRSPNKQTHLARSRPNAAFRPRPESAVQITRKNRKIATSQKRSNDAFEFLNRAVRRPGPLRENDQDIASLGEKLTTNGETL